jgi:hypothetical protein
MWTLRPRLSTAEGQHYSWQCPTTDIILSNRKTHLVPTNGSSGVRSEGLLKLRTELEPSQFWVGREREHMKPHITSI